MSDTLTFRLTVRYPPRAPESPARTRTGRPLSPECLAAASPHPGKRLMHPADLATHRAARRRAAERSLERDVARLLPHLDAEERVELCVLRDAGRTDVIPLDHAHAVIRERLAQLAQRAAA